VACKRLISNLLTVNKDKRWTAKQALACDWFQKLDSKDLSQRDLSGSLRELAKFKPKRKWHAAMHAVGFVMSAPFWSSNATSFSQQMSVWDKALLQESTLSTQSAPASTTLGSLMANIPRLKFLHVYELGRKLRKGSHATVWECMHKQTKDKFAVKMIQREGLKPQDDEAVLNEVAILQSLVGNKYVVQLIDFYEEEDCFYIVMELMHGTSSR